MKWQKEIQKRLGNAEGALPMVMRSKSRLPKGSSRKAH
jgi:hypothetical protein